MRLVLIEWIDSMGPGSTWRQVSDLKEHDDIVCRSVGWLAVDGDRHKIIVPHLHDENEDANVCHGGCGEMSIPSVAVLRMTDLTESGSGE